MINLLVSALLLATAADEAPLVHDGGVCAGLSWVTLRPSEKASIERGPDFNIIRFEGPAGPDDHWWGVYSGNYAQVHGNGPLLLERDGVVVHRAIEDGKFRGYLAEKAGRQNHFFGSVFAGTDADKAFFDRVLFGEKSQFLCAKAR